jgi:hypothetical protein
LGSGASKSSAIHTLPASNPVRHPALYGDQLRNRPAAVRNLDFLTIGDFVEQPRQMGLGFVDPYGLSHVT